MQRSYSDGFRRALGLALALVLLAGAAAGQETREPVDMVREVTALATGVPERAAALIRFAWSDEPVHPIAASIARETLVGYGDKALVPIRDAFRDIPRRYQPDAVAVLIAARAMVRSDLPSEYRPTLETTIWFGSPDAQRLAIPELSRLKYPYGLLTVIDAAYENPALTELVIDAVATQRNDKARHFLRDVLDNGTPEQRQLAGTALARIGGRALSTLNEAVLSEDPAARRAAVEVLLPISNTDHLSTLYTYIGRYSSDDSELLEKIRIRASQLEAIVELQLDAEAASWEFVSEP